jgi:hypothetical protein
MVRFPLVEIFGKRCLRWLLANDGQEKSTPADHSLLFAEGCREIKLRLVSLVTFMIQSPYVDGVLVHLQHRPQYFAGLQARLVRERVSNVEQLRERQGDNPVKVCAVLTRLESVDLAYREQALHTRKYRSDVSSVQQLDGDIHEVGPFRGEIVCEYLLECRNKL